MNFNRSKIAIIGLGYVGLPLAIEFGKKRRVIGFDTNKQRVNELKKKKDSNLEVSPEEFKKSVNLNFTNKIDQIKKCKIYIVALPTPIDEKKKPDLKLLKDCCKMIGAILKKGDLVIFESTVYPGVVEDICVKIIEKKSGLIFNKNFYCGYSPERINPGDKQHNLRTVIKVTSGSTPKISLIVDKLYKEIALTGTHMTPSIKVAEAAKVIENIQRDVNIALINEITIILNKLNIDIKSVLDAANTKWNFLPFKPGLVGGHCIGIDPYYLAYRSIKEGHYPKIILSGRKINDKMAFYHAKQLKEKMLKKKIKVKNANILIMGFSFKENCPDIRNSKIPDLIKGIKKYCPNVDVYDPLVNKKNVKKIYGIDLIEKPIKRKYNAIVIALAHDSFKKLTLNQIYSLVSRDFVIYDLKFILNLLK